MKDLDQLKRYPIIDLAKSLGLEVKGKQARCYNTQAHAHGDRNPSLGFDINRNRYKCFSCGVEGSTIDLFMGVRGLEFSEAVKELESYLGLSNPNKTRANSDFKPYKQEDYPKPQIEPINKQFSYIYEELLNTCKLDKESRDYLNARGITDKTIERFSLTSINDYQKTNQHLKEKFNKEELQQAGLFNNENLIFYKNKIVIPFIEDKKIIYLRGRYFDNGNAQTDGAKMLGLKGHTTKRLFNAEILKNLKDKVYICEGEFDTIILEQEGYNAVGLLGTTNFSQEMTELFKGLEVVLALDNDKAGKEGTKELAKMFLLKGQKVKSKQLPENIKDITDYYL